MFTHNISGLSNADRDLLTTILNHLKELHGNDFFILIYITYITIFTYVTLSDH